MPGTLSIQPSEKRKNYVSLMISTMTTSQSNLEVGLHKETEKHEMPELHREVHRRLWCVLHTWDWQFSALLSRPLIIDRNGCDDSPQYTSLDLYSPSPFLHMDIQSGLIKRLSARFGRPEFVTTPNDVKEYQNIVQDWIRKFPPAYDMNNPDTSKDEVRPWIKLHRHYLHTVAYSMAIEPVRTHLATTMNSSTNEDMLRIRRDGVNYSLNLMERLCVGFEQLWPRNAKFDFVVFSIFDTAALQTTILLRDEEGTVERRDDLLDAIDEALSMLKHLTSFSKAGQTYHQTLTRLRKKMLKKLRPNRTTYSSFKRARVVTETKHGLPTLTTPIVKTSTSDDDDYSSSSSESLAPDLFDDSLSPPPPDYVPQPSGYMGSEYLQPPLAPLEPPSTAIYTDGALNTAFFLEEPWALRETSVFQELRPQNDPFGANQKAAEAQEFDLATAPPMEALSEAITDTVLPNMSAEELGSLTELWRWDSLEPGSNSNSASNPYHAR